MADPTPDDWSAVERVPAAERLASVFDMFYQGQQGADRSRGGLGLGLALVKNLVALHGGTVQAHSDGPGRGSRFEVRLPLRSQPPLPPAAAEADWPSGEQAARQSRRVLVVDDNRDGAELVSELLALQGHEVRVAFAPDEALRMIEHFRPELALLDVGLPGMDGHELARRLRARLGEGCVLAALSGYGQESDRARARAAGFAHYLVKPASLAELQALVASLGEPRA